MYPLTWFYPDEWLSTSELLHFLGEDPCCIHNMPGMYSQLLIAQSIMNVYASYSTVLANKRSNFGIIGDRSSKLSSRTDESHSEANIIGLPIIVHVAIFQPFGNQGRSQLQYTFAPQMTVQSYIAPSS